MKTGAVFDRSRKYRYNLWREWDDSLPRVAFVMLNPSRADASINDQTITTCIGFAKNLGYGGMDVVNLFAYRSTEPGNLKLARDPVGKENDAYILEACSRADATIVAWGNHGKLLERSIEVEKLLAKQALLCFGITKQGHPRHPLYLKHSTKLFSYSVRFQPHSCD
jgi:hypothetical protein